MLTKEKHEKAILVFGFIYYNSIPARNVSDVKPVLIF